MTKGTVILGEPRELTTILLSFPFWTRQKAVLLQSFVLKEQCLLWILSLNPEIVCGAADTEQILRAKL